MTIIAKNVSGGEVRFLSVVLQDTEESILSDFFTQDIIFRDEDLLAFIASGDVVINDGTNDLSPAAAIILTAPVTTVNLKTGDVVIDPDDLDDSGTTNKFYPTADSDKLALIEDNADVTDATNVDAAGAVMNGDTSTAAMGFVINDPTFAAASATNLSSSDATKQYIQSYVAASVTSEKAYIGGYDVNLNIPNLSSPSPGIVKKGDVYDATTVGTFLGAELEIGDTLRAKKADPAVLADWVIIQTNLTAASIKTQYESNSDTNAFTDAMKAKNDFLTITAPANIDTIKADTATNNAKNTNVPTSLSIGTQTGTTLGITSDGSADDVILPQVVAAGNAGLMSGADKTILDDLAVSGVFGTEYGLSSSLAEITNGTDSNLLALATTIPSGAPSGTYRIEFDFEWAQNNNNGQARFIFRNNGIIIPSPSVGNTLLHTTDLSDYLTLNKSFIVTHTNGVASVVDFVYAAVGGTGTTSVREMFIQRWRIS